MAIAVFSVGSYKNMLFMLVVVINTAISTYQEIHSKRIIDKLSVMASSKATVIRDGKKQEISINSIVLDDILEFNSGNQIATDSMIFDGEVEVDESFITGESDTIFKKKGDMLLSGSFIVSGKCLAKVKHIGEHNYTAKISSEAKYVKKVNSEIMLSLNKIIKFLSFAIVPIGILLFFNQLKISGGNIEEAVVKSVAAVIGMIPEGLVLLTSTVLAISVIRLSKQKVLVQELYCIETLARVDTLCLDKTGTLTEGTMEVKVSKDEDGEEVVEDETIVNYYYTKQTFNLKIKKDVSSAIVNGVSNDMYNGLSKIEIARKSVNTTNIQVVYKITVINDGDLAGKGTIQEQIPAGMEFVKDESSEWKVDGKTATLETKELAAGEQAEYTVTMNWTKSSENIGTKRNTVKLINTENEAGFEEKDTKDNTAYADIVIAISTGANSYMNIAGGILLVMIALACGVYVVKKVED